MITPSLSFPAQSLREILPKKSFHQFYKMLHKLPCVNYLLKNRPSHKNEEKLRNSAASWLLKALQASDISNTETFCCIIALGLVCDQRRDNKITVANMEEAENVLTHIERYVYMQDAEIARKCADIALKLIGGEQLNQLEEQFLLKKLEIAD